MEEELMFTEDQAILADDEVAPEQEETLVAQSDIVPEESNIVPEEPEGSDIAPEDGFTLGTVKWFSRMKGWGFIEPDGGDRDVFVHYESIIGEGFRNLEKGERVQFRVEDSPKGPKAAQVSSLDTAF
jgi:CspA family cold shock protein